MAESRGISDRISGAIGAVLELLPIPLYVSLMGLFIMLAGALIDLSADTEYANLIAGIIGAYGIIVVAWGIIAYVVVFLIAQLDTYQG